MSENNSIKLLDIKSNKDFKEIIIKEYLSFPIKKIMINNILEFSKVNQNSLIKIDYALMEMVKTVSIITQYTNIEMLEDIVSAYDYMKENKIDEYVFDKISKDEILFIEKVIDLEIKQIKELDNSIQSVLSKFLNDLVDNLPDEKTINKIIKDIPKSLNKINPETLAVLKKI